MSKRNVRIAIRDTTDTHVVGFFDNKSGIKYNSANLTQFLKGACSVLVLTYHSKKMVAQSGQKLAFRFKDKDFWLNINSVKKTGYKIELTAYSLSLEANKEKRGPHKPANAMSIKQYIDYYDPEHSFEIGINEVADKSIKLEWSGTDTILARLYSVANSFGAELEFVTELNDDYSLKRHVVNIYREGNLGKDKTGMPVRVGEKLKVINYSDNMDDFYTAIRRTGKDGLTMAGLDKKIYDDKGNLLFYNNSNTIYAPQARDKYPSIARKTNDGYIINEDSETEHATKEALFGYMLSELKKHCELKVDYEVEGAVDGNIGDRKTLIDGRHFDPPLYVQARISEQTEALLETSDVKTTLSNYVRKSSQIANELLQRVEQLTLEATPYTIKLATNNGIVFKNNQGQSTIYPSLKRGQKPVECTWKWLVDNQGFGTSPTFEVKAVGMSSKLVLTAIALIDGKEVAREQVTFTNVNDGAKGDPGKSITITKTERQSDGVKVTFSDNKSIVVPKGDKGDPADSKELNQLKQEMNQARQGLDDVKADLLREKSESSAKIDQVKQDVEAICNQQTAYEQTNTQNLARITGQLGDKASKSEVKQTADGIREELASLSVGGRNLLKGSKGPFMPDRKPADFDNQVLYLEQTSIYMEQGQEYIISAKTDGSFTAHHDGNKESDNVVLWIMDKAVANYQIVSDAKTGTTGTEFVWNRPTGIYHLRVNTYRKDPQKLKSVWEVKVEQGSFKTDWSPAPEDTEGLITEAKATFERTAQGLRTDLTAVQTYVSADGARTEALRTYSREETARQLTAERKVIEAGYVAKAQHTEDVRGLTRRFEELNSGGPNLVSNGATELGLKNWLANGKLTADRKHPYFKNGTAAMFVLDTTEATVAHMQQNQYNVLKRNTDYTLSFTAFASNNVSGFRALVGLLSNTDHTWKKTLYTYTKTLSPTQAECITVQFNSSDFDGFALRFDNMGSSNGRSATVWISEIDVYEGTIKRPYQPSPENGQSYADTKLAEYKQTVDGQLAAVKQEVDSKVSQTTFDQRANQITQSVQELSNNTVKKNQLKIDENGLVSSSEKVVNGQTLASMISQNPEWVEIIAKLLKIKADMIVNGAITADKLNVKELSALASDLGKITAGEIEFTTRFRNSPSHDTWGTVPGEYNYDATVLINSSGIYSNGKIGRENKEDKTPTITPVSYFKNGELFFANLEAGHSLKYMQMNGIHPFVRGGSSLMYFGKKEDGKDALYITCHNAELYLKSDNYTDWKQSEVNNKVRWKVQGSLVIVDFNLQFDRDGTYHLVDIPKQYVPSNKMFPVQAWSLDRNKDRTAQLNFGGDLHIIGAERGIPYLGQIIWTY